VKYPLTIRGSLALLGGAYLVLGPASSNADLVAGIIGATLLALIISITIINLFIWQNLKKALSGSIRSSDGIVEASRLERFTINLPTINLLPLTEIRVGLKWTQTGVATYTHSLEGRDSKPRTLIEDIRFPHRGNWGIEGLNCELRDIFGLSAIRWIAPTTEKNIKVSPGDSYSRHIPVISTSERSGDAIEQKLTRSGDPYDLKAYHPTDGMKRIIWKLFAKSGELYSRLEEFSMTPEGRVSTLIIANPKDDSLCNWALGYLREMEALSLDLVVGAAGMHKISASTATSTEAAKNLLVDTTWTSPWDERNSSETILKELREDMELVKIAGSTGGSRLTRLIIFVSGQSIKSQEQVAALQQLGNEIENAGISPIFCCQEIYGPIQKKSAINKAIRNILFEENSLTGQSNALNNFPNFLKVCANSQWHVII
jgi:hypothetical protein